MKEYICTVCGYVHKTDGELPQDFICPLCGAGRDAFKLKEENEGYFTIKRIIGLPGENVQIKNGRIFIDGKALTDLPFDDLVMTEGLALDGVDLGEDEYFCLGDNRPVSYDSRYEEVGPVERSEIIGKVWIRIWPISLFGTVE